MLIELRTWGSYEHISKNCKLKKSSLLETIQYFLQLSWISFTFLNSILHIHCIYKWPSKLFWAFWMDRMGNICSFGYYHENSLWIKNDYHEICLRIAREEISDPHKFPIEKNVFFLSESECHVTVTHTKARQKLHKTGTSYIAALETIIERVE